MGTCAGTLSCAGCPCRGWVARGPGGVVSGAACPPKSRREGWPQPRSERSRRLRGCGVGTPQTTAPRGEFVRSMATKRAMMESAERTRRGVARSREVAFGPEDPLDRLAAQASRGQGRKGGGRREILPNRANFTRTGKPRNQRWLHCETAFGKGDKAVQYPHTWRGLGKRRLQESPQATPLLWALCRRERSPIPMGIGTGNPSPPPQNGVPVVRTCPQRCPSRPGPRP